MAKRPNCLMFLRSDSRMQVLRDDPRFAAFFAKLADLVQFLLPAQLQEGKAHLAIGFGCTGGQHRSVAVVEKLSARLAEQGWPVAKRHRELERRSAATAAQVHPVEQSG